MKEGLAEGTTAETRKLAAIMFTDMVGFSRQMGANEASTLRLLAIHNRVVEQAIAAHHGHIIKTFGDAFLVDFPSVVHAVQCAQRIQAQFRAHNAEHDHAEQVHIRIGIHLGDIVVQPNGDVLGDGVNIASRLQTLAKADTICISHKVYEEVEKKLALGTVVSLGRPKLKNIAPRFQIYALLPEKPQGLRQHLHVQRLKLRRVGTVVFVLVSVLLLRGLVIFLFPSLPTLITRHSSLVTEEAKPPSLPLPDKPSMVVLPFVNLSGDPGQEYFSDGITEELTASLSRLANLFVISRNSAFFYKGKAVKMPDLSKELGVKYVLEGSLRKAGDQVRITIQLIDANTDHHLWSERYDRSLKDIFALQDDIVQKIATTLELQLPFWEGGYQLRRHTDNLEAYDSYLRGLESLVRANLETKKEANEQARQMFERALELDPTYAEAYAGLGWTYFNEWFFQWNLNRAQSLERALEVTRQAITLDDSLSMPHATLGQIYLWNKQHDQAIAEVRRAIALAPNYSDNYLVLGIILVFAGQPEEAIEVIKRGMRLNPRYSGMYPANLGWAYRMAGRCEEALAPLQEALMLSPNFLPAHSSLAGCYAELGRQEEAQAQVAEVLRLNPHFSLEVMRRNLPYKDPVVLERYLADQRKAGLK